MMKMKSISLTVLSLGVCCHVAQAADWNSQEHQQRLNTLNQNATNLLDSLSQHREEKKQSISSYRSEVSGSMNLYKKHFSAMIEARKKGDHEQVAFHQQEIKKLKVEMDQSYKTAKNSIGDANNRFDDSLKIEEKKLKAWQ